MAGHSTPTGIFSVIQKQTFHRSNIYSGAPMPYMQRITWSGIALHAGVLPGYPASHGCIRMPGDFAVKLYNMTRSGARVLIAHNDVVPVPFEHARLFTKLATDKVSQADAPGGQDSKLTDSKLTDSKAADRDQMVRTAQTQSTVMSDAVDAAAHAFDGLVKPKPMQAAATTPMATVKDAVEVAASSTAPHSINEVLKQNPAAPAPQDAAGDNAQAQANQPATDAAKDGAQTSPRTARPPPGP